MSRRALGAVVAVVAASMAQASLSAASERAPARVVCPSCGHNLVLNPGAEAGKGAGSDIVVKVPDWKQTGGFTVALYTWSGGDLSPTTPGPKNRGKNYFYGGPDAPRSTGTQVVNIAQGGVSTGKVTFVLSGWLGGYSDQGDDATLYATFNNANGVALARASIGPVTAAQRDNVSGLLFRETSGLVPAATRSVTIELVMVRYVGSDNDGLADNLSLVFSLPKQS